MAVLRVRKRPVEVDAMQFDGTKERADAINEWITGTDTHLIVVTHEGSGPCPEGHPDCAYGIQMKTLESGHIGGEFVTASPGDYVIKGVKGEFYPCKPDIFRATYELVPCPDMECVHTDDGQGPCPQPEVL